MLIGRNLLAALMAIAVCCAADAASAESFLLKSGGRIEGEFLNPKRNSTEPYLVRTTDGVKLSLGKELVAKVVVKKDTEREYERLLPKVPDTAAGHWEMAEWCKEQGLRAQREFHLQEVIAREPDHAAAHLGLGHQRFEGKWHDPQEYMKSHGYLKHQGLWRTRQDVELALAQNEIDEVVIEWRQKIRIWRSWIGKKRDAEAIANFKAIRDANAAPALIDLLEQKGQPRELRLLMIDVLSDLPGQPAEGTFIKLALADAEADIRDACLDQLVRHQSKRAVHQYMGLIKDDKATPLVINRAAAALGRLGDPIATPALIDSLVTTHEIVVQPGGQQAGGLGPITTSFDPANPANGGGFSAGAPKPVKVKRNFESDQVLSALNTLHPGVNFGFNESAWRQWYVEKHQPPTVNLRRGQ